MLTAETKRRIDSCRDILVGKLPLPTDQVELITLALIYKFMDDLDEESASMGGRRSFFTGRLEPYRWRELMRQTVSAEERMTRFADGLELLGGAKKLRVPKKNGRKGEEEEVDVAAHLPALFRDIFRNAFLKFRDGRILTLFLTELGGFTYSHSEELGNAFEYILQCMGAQGDNGQFRTPRHIIDFIVACLDPQPTDKILDPACGTGGFLVSAFRHILQQHTSPGSTVRGDRLGHEQRQRLYGHFTGYDINDQMVKLSRVNLFLHEFASPTIHIYDTLTNDARWSEKYDLILANPPFMTPKGGVVPHTKFRVPAKKSEVLFTDYIAEHLTPEGRAGIIVPNGIVATTQTAYVKLRRFLVEDSLVAVVSLPAGCFKPYSGVKTSILFLDKKLARTTDRILFLKIAADGFDLGDKRTPIEGNDLPEAGRVVRAWLMGELGDESPAHIGFTRVPKRELLADGNVNLGAERFLGATEFDDRNGAGARWPIVRLASILAENPKNGYSGKPVQYPTKLKVLSLSATTSGRLDPSKFKYLEEEIPAEASCRCRKGDIYLQRGNTSDLVGTAALFDSDASNFIYPDLMIRVRADEQKIITKFLLYVLQSEVVRKFLKDRAGGSAGNMPKINQGIVESIPVPLPSLEAQGRIVAEIEAYQQVIDGARQILAAYHPRFDIDPEWPRTTLQEVCSLSSGGTPPKNNPAYWDGPIPWVSAKDMKAPRLSDAQLHVSGPAIAETATELAPKGSILVLVRGMGLANGVPICELLRACAFNQDIKAIRPKEVVEAAYLAAALRQEEPQLKNAISTAAHGTLKIETDRLLEIEVPLPPLPEQHRIVAELDAEAARIDSVRALIPTFEAKIQRVLDRVWGGRNGTS